MYTDFYKLKAMPFSLTPDPNFLYMSKSHQRCTTILKYGMLNNAGFTVISGEVGSGKSVLIQHLLKTIDHSLVTIGHINNTFKVRDDVLSWVLQAFNITDSETSRLSKYEVFTNFVLKEYSEGKRVVLIIDEAQNLDVDCIEELRLLSNINIAEEVMFQMLFFGQPEMVAMLELPELRQFSQRVGVEYHIPHLNYVETKKYIEHRLEVAGAKTPIFKEDAIAAIYCYSLGIPRKINNFANFAIVYGFAEEAPTIDADIVNASIEDRLKSGLFKLADRSEGEVKSVEQWLLRTKKVSLHR